MTSWGGKKLHYFLYILITSLFPPYQLLSEDIIAKDVRRRKNVERKSVCVLMKEGGEKGGSSCFLLTVSMKYGARS